MAEVAADRYVVLGLAHVRSTWFTDVARWSTAGAVPVEFVKCLSAEELRARLRSGRPLSALLVDAGLPGLDRDLVDLAGERECPILVVERQGDGHDWNALGAAATVPAAFDRETLLDVLARHGRALGDASLAPFGDEEEEAVGGWRGHLVGVTGAGGTGRSTMAMALAQGCGHDIRYAGLVALADFALDADQAMLHDARDIVPGVQELVELHRTGRPAPDQIRKQTYDVANRHYSLVLGLRRHRDWAVLRPRSFEAAVDGLRRTYRLVVADMDSDVEGEAECGSVEVEERNLMARTVARQADVLMVVGQPGLKGLHALVRTVGSLGEYGVGPSRMVAVVNRAPRNHRTRAEYTRAFAELSSARAEGDRVAGPVFVPERRGLDDLIRDGARFPASMASLLAGTVRATIERTRPEPVDEFEPAPVVPGSLGAWTEQGVAYP